MQNVQRVEYERDYKLVDEYYERGKHDNEDYEMFKRMKLWFEGRWQKPFVVGELRQGRNV